MWATRKEASDATDSLDVLVPVGHGDWGQSLLGLERPRDIVVGNVEIRGDVRGLEGLDAELGLALLLFRDRNGVGRRLSVHGCESSVGHLDRGELWVAMWKVLGKGEPVEVDG